MAQISTKPSQKRQSASRPSAPKATNSPYRPAIAPRIASSRTRCRGRVPTIPSMVSRGLSHRVSHGDRKLWSGVDVIEVPPAKATTWIVYQQHIAFDRVTCLTRSCPRRFRKRFPDPVNDGARSGIALEMVLHQKPDVASPRQQCCAQSAIGQQLATKILRQDTDRLMRHQERPDEAKIVRDAAGMLLQSLRFQKRSLRNRAKLLRIGTDEGLHIPVENRFDQEQPELAEL